MYDTKSWPRASDNKVELFSALVLWTIVSNRYITPPTPCTPYQLQALAYKSLCLIVLLLYLLNYLQVSLQIPQPSKAKQVTISKTYDFAGEAVTWVNITKWHVYMYMYHNNDVSTVGRRMWQVWVNPELIYLFWLLLHVCPKLAHTCTHINNNNNSNSNNLYMQYWGTLQGTSLVIFIVHCSLGGYL